MTWADVYAPTVSWDNSGADGDWDLDAGWDTATEPVSSDKVAIDNGAIVTITQPGEVADEIRLASTSTSSGTIRVLSGDLTFRLAQFGDEGTGVVDHQGGDVVSTNRVWIGARGPGYSSLGDGTYNLSGGTVTVQGTSSTAMRVGLAGATGTLNISGGTWTSSAQFNLTAGSSVAGLPAQGTVNLSGNGSLVVNSTFINDASGSAPGISLLTLTGSGASMTAINYVQNAEGAVMFTTDAVGVTPIRVSSTTDLEGDVMIDLTALIGLPPVITLIENSGVNPVLGSFANAPEGTSFGAYTLTYLHDSGDGNANDVALVIPEPAAGALCLLGFGAMLRRGA
ncbi:MAG: hypothetical protein R3C45_15340 [Phycisphaerales bacterium]